VMLAIGRDPETKKIGLDKAGVNLNSTGKIPTTHERTNVPHIYAIGDIITVIYPHISPPLYELSHLLSSSQDVPSKLGLELTPVAIKAGLLLARRLYAGTL